MDQSQFTDLQRQVTGIETQVNLMYREIMGNGQPGAIRRVEIRLEPLESFREFTRGALWVIGGLLTLLGGGAIVHIIKAGF